MRKYATIHNLLDHEGFTRAGLQHFLSASSRRARMRCTPMSRSRTVQLLTGSMTMPGMANVLAGERCLDQPGRWKVREIAMVVLLFSIAMMVR